jgi:hypothetical protein
LEGLAIEYVSALYGHLVYFMDIWNICGFTGFGMLYQEKIGNPGPVPVFKYANRQKLWIIIAFISRRKSRATTHCNFDLLFGRCKKFKMDSFETCKL